MASWRDEIRGRLASFRGVWFHPTEAETQVGRRNEVHEYPERDRPYIEDLGLRARQWLVQGHVVGDNYLADRDRLIRAFEEKGPGELVHPRYGTLQVCVVGLVSVRESHAEGGVAFFSATFVDAGSNQFPTVREDTALAVAAEADALDVEAADAFADAMDFDGPDALVVGVVDQAQSGLDELIETAQRVMDLDAVSALVGEAIALAGEIAGLVYLPLQLAQRLAGVHVGIAAGVRLPLAALQALRGTVGRNAPPAAAGVAPLAGSTRARVQGNLRAIASLVRSQAMAGQARMLAVAVSAGVDAIAAGAGGQLGVVSTRQSMGSTTGQAVVSNRLSVAGQYVVAGEGPIGTAQQAAALRDVVLAQIDAELEDNDPPAQVAAALVQLRGAVARDVAARMELLRQRGAFTPAAVLPAVVLAHRIYQDAWRADELVARNAVRHPAFVPARELEVLR